MNYKCRLIIAVQSRQACDAKCLRLCAESACDGACAGTYDKCIGRDIFSLKACCDPNDQCVKFSKWYGQCRPKDNGRFDDDWLGVAVDCNGATST